MTHQSIRRWLHVSLVPAFICAVSLAALKANEDAGFSTDITVRQSRTMGDGKIVPNYFPTMRFRFERSQVRGRWQTVLTRLPQSPTDVAGAKDLHFKRPDDVARIEDDGDGMPRVYDQSGRVMRVPSLDDLVQLIGFGGPDRPLAPISASSKTLHDRYVSAVGGGRSGSPWSRGVGAGIMALADAPQRKREIERHLGRSVGKQKGLDRYLAKDGKTTREVLVEPGTSVPLEVNTAEDGTLVMHRRMAYQQDAAGRLFRIGQHTERLQAHSGGQRAVTDVEFSNYRVGPKGGVR